jgi:hypothetical protein
MTDEIYWKIRRMMTEQGAWNGAVNMKVYTTDEYLQEFGHLMSDELKLLLKENVTRMQSYLDDRILEGRKC